MSSAYELCRSKGWPLVVWALYVYGPCSEYALTNSLKLGKEAVRNALSTLQRFGLCSVSKSGTFPFAFTIDLTTKGRKFATVPIKDLPAFLWNPEQTSSYVPAAR